MRQSEPNVSLAIRPRSPSNVRPRLGPVALWQKIPASAQVGLAHGIRRLGRLGKLDHVVGVGSSFSELTEFRQAPDQPATNIDRTRKAAGVVHRMECSRFEYRFGQLDNLPVVSPIIMSPSEMALGLDAQGVIPKAFCNRHRARTGCYGLIELATQRAGRC